MFIAVDPKSSAKYLCSQGIAGDKDWVLERYTLSITG